MPCPRRSARLRPPSRRLFSWCDDGARASSLLRPARQMPPRQAVLLQPSPPSRILQPLQPSWWCGACASWGPAFPPPRRRARAARWQPRRLRPSWWCGACASWGPAFPLRPRLPSTPALPRRQPRRRLRSSLPRSCTSSSFSSSCALPWSSLRLWSSWPREPPRLPAHPARQVPRSRSLPSPHPRRFSRASCGSSSEPPWEPPARVLRCLRPARP